MTDSEGKTETGRWKDFLIGCGVIVAMGGAAYWLLASSKYNWRFEMLWEYREPLLDGWLQSWKIAVLALVCSTFIGVLVILGRKSRFRLVRVTFSILVELARGTPLIVQIFFGFYVAAWLFAEIATSGTGLFADFLRFTGIDFRDRMVVGVTVLSLFSGAYLGEIFRGGVESIPASQLEAARAVGFSRLQIARFVIIPQAMRRVLPAVAGQFANLVKDSSLLHVIAVNEITYEFRWIIPSASLSLEGYCLMAVAYLAITLPIFWFSRRLEQKFAYIS